MAACLYAFRTSSGVAFASRPRVTKAFSLSVSPSAFPRLALPPAWLEPPPALEGFAPEVGGGAPVGREDEEVEFSAPPAAPRR